MKKLLTFSIVALLFVSCNNDAAPEDVESYRAEAFESAEYKALKESFQSYVEYESSIVQVFEEKSTSKLTEDQFAAKEEAYVQELSRRFFTSKEKHDAFVTKYPLTKMTTQQLKDRLRAETK